MSEEELAELERLANASTRGPWQAFFWRTERLDEADGKLENAFCSPEKANVGIVCWVDPKAPIYATEEPDPVGPIYVPDNGVSIASKREVNCGYDMTDGEPIGAADIYLKAADAMFIAAAKQAVPALIAEVRRLRAIHAS